MIVTVHIMDMAIPIMDTVMVDITLVMATVVAAITITATTCTIPITDRYTMDLAGQLNRTGWLHPARPLLQTHDA